MFKQLFQSTLSSFLPSQCAVCRTWPAAPVCSACMARFSSAKTRCKTCAIGLPADLSLGLRTGPGLCLDCIEQAPPVDSMLAAVDYAYPWSALVSAYKFGEQAAWAPFFAALLLKAPGVRQAFEHLEKTDLILPVPLARERLQSRGFNQAWELAHALARQSGSLAKTDNILLLRVKNTRPQNRAAEARTTGQCHGCFSA